MNIDQNCIIFLFTAFLILLIVFVWNRDNGYGWGYG